MSARKPSAEERLRAQFIEAAYALDSPAYATRLARLLRAVKAEAAERAKANVYEQLEWQVRTSFRFDELRAAIMARPR